MRQIRRWIIWFLSDGERAKTIISAMGLVGVLGMILVFVITTLLIGSPWAHR